MEKIKGHIKKSYYVYALLAVIIAGCVAAGGYIKNIHADDQNYVVADEVVINGKTYTSSNKMNVLMIAPHEAYDEIGILMGDSEGAIKFTDLMAKAPSDITDGTFRDNIIKYQTFTNNNGLLMNTPYRIGYKFPDGTITENISTISSADIKTKLNGKWSNLKVVITKDGKEIPYRNVFGAMIFDNYDMDNKMNLSVKKLADVTMSDLKNADLVYISGHSHNTFGIDIYNYIHNSSVGAWSYLRNNDCGDFDADEALYLLLSYAKGEKKVIFDSTARQDGDNGMNLNKIGILFTAIDPDVLISDFAKVKEDNGNYYGTKGSIRIENNKIHLYYKRTNDEIKFSANMFLNYGNNFAVSTQDRDGLSYATRVQDYKDGYPCYDDRGYPYYNSNAIGKYFVNPSLFVFDGSNSMTSSFTSDKVNTTDGSGRDYKGTTFDDAYNKNGNNGELHPADAIEYILGVYTNTNINSIKVLEIEPAGFSRYNNDDGKKAIASWFGMAAKQYNDIKSNITVDCYSMTAFDGLNKDIRSDYDMVIVGAYDYDRFNTDIYKTPYDAEMKLNDYTLTGNDITHKAYEKLYQYVAAGMPLVLDDGVYYNLESVVDGDCTNLKDVQAVSLKRRLVSEISYAKSNIVHVNTRGSEAYKLISKTLYYVDKPYVNIGPSIGGSRISDYSEKSLSNGNLSADGTVANTSLPDMHFTGSLSGNGSYRVKIYVDRNNDSIFAENYSGEKNELIYYEKSGSGAATDANGNILGVLVNGGSFDVAIPLPKTLRGYIKWRVEVTDVTTGAVKNSEGAFAISAGTATKTIKVLQVENDSETAHINLTGDAFTNTFERTTSVTGLSVDIVKVKKSGLNKEIEENSDYLNQFSMIVLGFSDNYGNDSSDSSKNLSDKANDALYEYIEAGNSVLYTHDSMSYKKGSSSSAASNENEINSFTRKFKDVIGMKSGFSLTDVLKLKLDSYKSGKKTLYYSIYDGISATGSTRVTNRVKQLNSGQITEYPYTLSSTSVISVSDTHAQYYQLDLEAKQDAEDVVVWYTLAGNGGESAKYFDYTGQDAVNNYYAYSIGNVTYTSAGHSMIDSEGDEMELFVNTFVRALLAGNNAPQVEYEDAEQIDGNNYAIYYRQRPNTDSLTIKYTVTDADIISNAGQVKESYLYWDRDGDGVYTEGTDLRIGYLDMDGNVFTEKPSNGGVYCGRPYSLTLWDTRGVCSSNMTADVLSEMKDKMANGTLTLGIVAIDGSKAIGYASLQIAYRPLFNLN